MSNKADSKRQIVACVNSRIRGCTQQLEHIT